METRAALSAAQDQGGERTGQALDQLYEKQGPRRFEAAGAVAGQEGRSVPSKSKPKSAGARGAGMRAAPPVPSRAEADSSALQDFVEFAKKLFFPDGRGAGVISRRVLRPEAMPTDDEMYQEMELSPLTYQEREAAVQELFKQAGAKPEEVLLQDVGRGQKNVYVVKKGRTDRVIVVSAHHDKANVGHGTIDNWSGATMVANVYQAMRDMDTEATYVFISFAREEDGLIGSSRYLKALPEAQRKKIVADINLDTLAVDGTYSWKNNSTRSLLDLVKKVAAGEKLDLKEQTLWGGDADSSSFRAYGIAAMTLFGVSPERVFDIVHSPNDTMAVFSMAHYRNAFLLTVALLKALNLLPVTPDAMAAVV